MTGGIGSGKTEAGKVFAGLGAFLIDSDVLAREALGSGMPGLRAIGARWPQVVGADGTLDREALAAVIFGDKEARLFVNGIVHPYVRERSAGIEATAPAGALIVHDVPLLFEAGFFRHCDANVLVVAPREQRIARLMARNAWTREEIEARMAAQIDPERARELADFVIENDGTLDDLRARTKAVAEILFRRNSMNDSGE
ncbi:MAG TPA: dephospho-CoA kinase [Candidatus Baltobacteraceae bacterium]|nr:dephospho-CoA kinase [Candidatus Baltobacteraceae bacterium]